MPFTISTSPRVRPSPFYHATIADGVTSFTTYNHMMMPTSYGDPMAEYWRLIEGVSMWDVAVERQVQLKGPDAGRLAQALVVTAAVLASPNALSLSGRSSSTGDGLRNDQASGSITTRHTNPMIRCSVRQSV